MKQWKFSSSSTPNKLARPTILEWRLLESNLDNQLRYDNTFHTAFAFEHDGQPFFMRVQVSGCLEGVATHLRLPTPLDELAKNIPSEMDKKKAKLVQVPKDSSGANLPYEILDVGEPDDEQEDNRFKYDPSPIPCSLGSEEPIKLQDLERVSLTLLSPREPSTRQSSSGRKLEIPLPTIDQHPELTIREPSSLNGRVKIIVNPDNPPGQKQDEPNRSVTVIEPHTSHENLKSLLGMPRYQ